MVLCLFHIQYRVILDLLAEITFFSINFDSEVMFQK